MHLVRLSLALLFLFLATGTLPAADERLAAPSAEEQARAEKLIRQLFAREYAVRTRTGILALATKLSQQAADTRDDPASRYVLYQEAANLAASVGDLATAVQAANQMSKLYLVSGAAIKAKVFETAAPRFTSATDNRIVAEPALAAAAEGLDDEDYASATRLLKVAATAARNARNVPLISAAEARTKEVDTLKAEYEKVKPLLERLKEKPDDAEANGTVGKYYCLLKGNWEKGLPLLAKGDDAKLKELATTDLGEPALAPGQVELGEAWLALGKAGKDMAGKQLKWRARYWFEKALVTAEGETRTRLEAYLKDIPPREGPAGGLARVNLSDMEEFDVKVGYGKFARGGRLGYNLLGKPGEAELSVNGKKYTNTVSAHPPTNGDAIVKYRLGKAAKEFRTSVALNDTATNPESPMTFKVLGDGKELWASKPVQTAGQVQEGVVNVTGVDVLELRVHCPGSQGYAHAVWLDPHVLTTSKVEVRPPATVDDSAKLFVGLWSEQNVAGQGVDALYTIDNRGGRWSIVVQYLRRRQVVGTAEGTDIKYADGKLTFGLHHVKKVAAHWEDSTDVATVDRDRIEIKWKTPTAGGTNHLTRARR